MQTRFISLTPQPPTGFEVRTPIRQDFLQGRIAIWAESLPDAMAFLEDDLAEGYGLVITRGEVFSHAAVGPSFWHLCVPDDLLPGMQAVALGFLDAMGEGQRTLKKSEHSFRRLFENTEVSIWHEDLSNVHEALADMRQCGVIDLRHHLQENPHIAWDLAALVKVLHVNQATLTLFGAKGENELLCQIDKTFGPDAIEVFIDELCAIWEKQPSFRSEASFRTLDGTEFTAIISFVIPTTADGFRSVPISISDIDKNKRIEESLKAEKKRANGILEGTNAGTWNWNILTATLTINERWAAIIGYSLTELEPINLQTWVDSLHPEDAPRTKALVDRHLAGELDYYDAVFRQKHKNGGWVWINARGKIVERDDAGKPLRMSGTHLDITRRKNAEEELKQLRNYLANIINSMPSILIGVDAEGQITQWNTEAEKNIGLTAEQAVGQPLARAIPRLAVDIPKIREAIQLRQQQVATRSPVLKDGKSSYEDITIYPLVADGVAGAVIRVDDVTERVRLEEMIIQNEKMLSVGGLAAGMAHEINNPLAGMMQTASVLAYRLSSNLPANLQAAEQAGITMTSIRNYMQARDVPIMLEQIQHSGVRAAEIVTNMLSFAHKSSDSFSSHNLDKLLESSLELASSDYNLQREYDFRRIEIIRHYAEDLPMISTLR